MELIEQFNWMDRLRDVKSSQGSTQVERMKNLRNDFTEVYGESVRNDNVNVSELRSLIEKYYAKFVGY